MRDEDNVVPYMELRGNRQASNGEPAKGGRPPVHAAPYQWIDPEAISPRQWVYGRHLIRKFVSATVAPGGVGKTSLAIAETLSMVSGIDLLASSKHLQPMRVWYLNLEDPREEITRQVQAAALFYDLKPVNIGDRLFVDSGREQEFVIADQQRSGALICRPVVDSLIAELQRHRIDVLVVDPFVSSHAVSENDNSAMDLVVKQWGKIADAGDCAVSLIHHTRKTSGDSEITAESSRGGKALTDGCRSVRVINRMTKEEASNAGVDNHRLYFRTYNDKANLAPPSEKSDWFCLNSVSLRNGFDGPSDEIGVVSSWKWPDAFAGMSLAIVRKVQDAIHQGEWKESVQARNWAGYAVAGVLGLDHEAPADKNRIKQLLKEWMKNGSLKVVTRTGNDRHPSPFVEVGEWANAA